MEITSQIAAQSYGLARPVTKPEDGGTVVAAAQEFAKIMEQGETTAKEALSGVLIVALIVGLIIGLFQALTSIQEMTLTFVPKVGAMLAVFWVSMSFMTKTLTSFWTDNVVPMIVGG